MSNLWNESIQNQNQISEQSGSIKSARPFYRSLIPSPRTQLDFWWCRPLRWIIAWCILTLRLVGIVLFLLWACDCFFREFRTTTLCRHFSFFRNPQLLISLWLLVTIALSLILVFILPCSPGLGPIFLHLLKRKYFYKISFMLLLVIVYDVLILLDHSENIKTMQYVCFILEVISLYLLMLKLNFTPRFVRKVDGEYFLKSIVYKVALALYSLECLSIYISGTTIVLYHILTISTCTGANKITNGTASMQDTVSALKHSGPHDSCLKHDYVTVIELLLLMNSNAFRYILGDFFLSKLFSENSDILGGGYSLNNLCMDP